MKKKTTITSPSAGSVIDGPFVLVGKAEPNTTVNVAVSPIYKLPKSGTGTVLRVSTPLHEPQEFTAKADANGVWQSRLIEVKYDPKATDRRIFASVYQIWGSEVFRSGNTEYLGSPKLTIIMGTIKVPAKPKEEKQSSGQPQTDEGIVKGGSEMTFQISSPKNNTYVAGVWATYTVRSKGIWGTPEIDFIKKIEGYSCWANTYTITASLVNENGKLVRTVNANITRMKTKAI